MTPADPDPEAGADAAFASARPRLIRLAYRMLGSRAEAEDVVQDAWLRWHGAAQAGIRDPAAFLHRTVARLCLDHLKSARHRREVYPGPWLPEPVLHPDVTAADDITLHLMVALERLSPLERAAFLLHDVFETPFEEVARVIGRDPAACRQLASRARSHVRAARPRFPVAEATARTVAAAFHAATRTGDTEALRSVLAADVVVYTDGGGQRPAARNPIVGEDRVVRFFAGLARKSAGRPVRLLHEGWIDGLPGFVTVDRNGVLQTTAVAIEGGRVIAVYIVRNPDKLRHLGHLAAVEAPLGG
ncbi:sigma-70 family RNA polymerase sigma factor [Stella sp.]|uniref:sigma-70 family RNA polymerase sigma factor n=1 Tax=Stella sp. TaxID=2912054 RepID=UPI0035ADFA60